MTNRLLVSLLAPSGPAPSATTGLDDWDALIAEAARHGVAPQLHEELSAGEIPASASGRLRDLFIHSKLRAQSILEDAATVVQALQGRSVEPIALKGLHLAFSVYPDPALRPMNDIDLLVRHRDLERAAEVLNAMGYRIHPTLGARTDYTLMHHVRPVLKQGAHQIELHHSLEPGGAPFATDLEAVWRRSSAMALGDAHVGVMATDDLLLHLSTHVAYNHRFDVRLLALIDIATVVLRREVDWDRLVHTANTDGRARYLYTTLHVLRRLWPDWDVPAGASGLDHYQDDESVADVAARHVATLPVAVPGAVRGRGTDGRAGRFSILLRSLFPTPERMRAIYRLPPESRRVFLWYVIRPFDLVRRRAGDALGLVLRTKQARAMLERDARSTRLSNWAESHPSSSS